ncbi:MAG: cyclic nucleotide-binding domain-containing protein [Myxococcota bacterium]|nr:cyclic nucleotide-binding domain-containing protein [Myxococcota bacterium]
MDTPVTLEHVIRFLLETPLFEALEPAELAEVVGIMQVQRLRDGQRIFGEGDEGDAWYVIFDGEASVSKSTAFGPGRTIALLQRRGIFGEMAVLDGSARSAAVTARGNTTLFKFPRVDFQELVEGGSLAAYKLVYAMAGVLCQRQRAITQQLSDVIEQQPAEPKDALKASLGDLLDTYSVSE